jgi:hypothetical protein
MNKHITRKTNCSNRLSQIKLFNYCFIVLLFSILTNFKPHYNSDCVAIKFIKLESSSPKRNSPDIALSEEHHSLDNSNPSITSVFSNYQY